MSTHPLPPAPAEDEPGHAAYYRQVLHELLENGMDLARAIGDHAKAADPNDPAAAPVLAELASAYERVARGIRRTIMLAERVGAASPASAARRASARRRIIRDVEDAIQRDANPADRNDLQAELQERLDGPDLLEDIDHRPLPDIIAEICRDLGLANLPGLKLHKRRTPADIAALCDRAAASAHPTDPNPDQPERFHRLVPTPNGI